MNMRVSVEITSSLGRRLNVAVPAEQLSQAEKGRIDRLMQTVKMDGFRPGKVPRRVVEQQYGEAVHHETVEKFLQSSLSEALTQEKLRPAGYPTIESLKADKGQALEYTAAFEVFPEISLHSLADVTLEKTVVEIAAADIDRVIEQMRKQHGQWHKVDRAAKMGDRVIADMTRLVDGQPVAEGEAKQAPFILDEQGERLGFSKLVGHSVGDEVIIDLGAADAQPKIQAKLNITAVEEQELPKLDDEFAGKLGVEGGIESLTKEVREHMQRELDDMLKAKLKEQLLEKLIELHNFELPKALVEDETKRLEKETLERFGKNISADQIPAAMRENMQTTARRRVTLSIIFPELVKKYDLKVNEERVRQHAEQLAGSFDDPQAMLNMIYGRKEIMNGLRSQILEEQVIDKLLEEVKFNDKPASYADIVNWRAQAGYAPIQQQAAHSHHDHDHDHCDHDHDHDHSNCDHDHHHDHNHHG